MLIQSWLTLFKNSLQKSNSRRSGASGQKRPRSVVSTQPAAEMLESRELLSAVTYGESSVGFGSLSNGVPNISGTDLANGISPSELNTNTIGPGYGVPATLTDGLPSSGESYIPTNDYQYGSVSVNNDAIVQIDLGNFRQFTQINTYSEAFAGWLDDRVWQGYRVYGSNTNILVNQAANDTTAELARNADLTLLGQVNTVPLQDGVNEKYIGVSVSGNWSSYRYVIFDFQSPYELGYRTGDTSFFGINNGQETARRYTRFREIDIVNVPPAVTVRNLTVTVDEGQIATNGGSFSDTGLNLPVISASVGSVSQTGGGSIAYVGSIGGLGTPIEMAFDTAGNLFVVEDTPGAVSKSNSSGTLIARWSVGGATTGLAVDSVGNVYVTSKALHNIKVYTNSGAYTRTIGGFGSGNGQFNEPLAMTLDAAGNMYVADSGNRHVQVLDNNGNFLRKWGTPGSGNGQFNFPQGIELDSAGNVYVTDRLNNRLQKFDNNGNFLTKWNVAGNTAGVGIDSADRIYVSNFSNPSVQVFTSTGTLISTFGSTGSGPGQFNLPHGIEFDAQGSIWVADWINGRVQEFTIPNLWSWSFATSDGNFQSQTVTITADDGDTTNNIGSTTFTLIVNNVAPTAVLSNGGAVNEGSVGSVSYSSQFDPSTVDTSAGFHSAYDFDNDGTFESGDGTYSGSGTSASAVVPASFLADGPGTRTVKGRILDKDGGYTDYTTTITVKNVAPELTSVVSTAPECCGSSADGHVTISGWPRDDQRIVHRRRNAGYSHGAGQLGRWQPC